MRWSHRAGGPINKLRRNTGTLPPAASCLLLPPVSCCLLSPAASCCCFLRNMESASHKRVQHTRSGSRYPWEQSPPRVTPANAMHRNLPARWPNVMAAGAVERTRVPTAWTRHKYAWHCRIFSNVYMQLSHVIGDMQNQQAAHSAASRVANALHCTYTVPGAYPVRIPGTPGIMNVLEFGRRARGA